MNENPLDLDEGAGAPVNSATPDEPKKSTFRGPLRYEVETSSPQIEAGKKCSVFLKVVNPYDVPVNVVSAGTVIPVEFQDAKQMDSSFFKQLRRGLWRESLELASTQILKGIPLEANRGRQKGGEGEAPPSKIALQPGNSTLFEFKLRTKHTIFFAPSLYNLHIQRSTRWMRSLTMTRSSTNSTCVRR